MKTTRIQYGTFLVVFLGMIFGFGPFLTDMYLPAFPQLQAHFGTDARTVQMSLSSCMLGLAFGQVLWGPLSDRYGRRGVTMVSLLMFMISCVGCILAPGMAFLIAMRFLQGLGGSGGIVLSRSIAADLYSGRELARVMALVGAVNGIAPVTAPVVGGLLTDSAGWRGIFAVLLAIGFVLFLGSLHFRESLPAERRSDSGLSSILDNFRQLLGNRRYVWCILQYGFLHGMFFSYLSSSPFIVQDHYGFSATGYSIFFALNATTVGVASVLSMKFRTPARCTMVSSAALLGLSLAVAAVLGTGGPVWAYAACTLLQVFCCGLCFASTPAMTLDLGRGNAGAAAALLGVSTYLVGFIVTPLVGVGDSMLATGIVYVVSSALALYFALRLDRTHSS